MFNVTSVYSYTGDSTATLNSLTNVQNASLVDVASVDTLLSADNYVNSELNPANQLILKAMPMSWWVSGLTSNTIKYFPFSGGVNWSYTTPSGTVIHIGREISDLLLPNRNQSSSRDSNTNVITTVFEPKLGLNRTDSSSMGPRRPLATE